MTLHGGHLKATFVQMHLAIFLDVKLDRQRHGTMPLAIVFDRHMKSGSGAPGLTNAGKLGAEGRQNRVLRRPAIPLGAQSPEEQLTSVHQLRSDVHARPHAATADPKQLSRYLKVCHDLQSPGIQDAAAELDDLLLHATVDVT